MAPGTRGLSPLTLPEGTRVGRWRVVRQVGQGGFGTVYAVREADAAAGPLYALKLAQTPEDAGFGREAQALRRMSHPGVVRLVEEGLWEAGAAGHPYLVLEYAHGEGLYRWAWLRNPTARQVAGLLLQVAEALEAAHAVGVLHRDFKGGNVVVGPGPRARVLDWGAGLHPEAEALTCTGRMPPGTPLYYSPQVVRWRARALRGGGGRYPYTVADELYAVGVTFHRVLADEYPPLRLEDLEDEDGLEALASGPPALPNPRVPPALAALVMELLAPRPEARPASMAALAARVRGALEGAGAAWDAPLFEWYSGPESQSRTTDEDGGWGPVAPGDEAALLKDRWRRPEAQADRAAARWLRRRHPQALAVQEADAAAQAASEARVPAPASSPVEAKAGARPSPTVPPQPPLSAPTAAPPLAASGGPAAPQAEPVAPGAVPAPPGHRGRSLAVGAVLLAAVVGALVLGRSRVPPASGPVEAVDAKVAPAPRPHHAAAEGAAPASSPPPSPLEPAMPTASAPPGPGPGLVSTLKRGVVAGCAAATLACPGPQVRPTPGTPCPEGALEAMRELRLNVGRQVNIYVNKDKPGSASDPLFVRDGDIVSRVFRSSSLPDGTLIEGRLWTRGERIFGRYTALELPNGRRYPVCLVLCNERGCLKHSASTPEAPALAFAEVFKVVDVFP
ncbi:serine/threonine-protein kinase [Pyxidicoccus trucidator]|uniref:serine/threonine-protein kinase n=1 Tax=Pyxidicoccus trucidator TaxID=2709662 RepID=UPI0013DC5D23|nr:serine/threonine-protein kinase [Pyxidicoccus trucidator]